MPTGCSRSFVGGFFATLVIVQMFYLFNSSQLEPHVPQRERRSCRSCPVLLPPPSVHPAAPSAITRETPSPGQAYHPLCRGREGRPTLGPEHLAPPSLHSKRPSWLLGVGAGRESRCSMAGTSGAAGRRAGCCGPGGGRETTSWARACFCPAPPQFSDPSCRNSRPPWAPLSACW